MIGVSSLVMRCLKSNCSGNTYVIYCGLGYWLRTDNNYIAMATVNQKLASQCQLFGLEMREIIIWFKIDSFDKLI